MSIAQTCIIDDVTVCIVTQNVPSSSGVSIVFTFMILDAFISA